jgi:aryl-alcohol dehydrogenase-like predicted oxidoreductase
MRYRPFGQTGLTVSEIGFGANSVSGQGSYGFVPESEGIAAIQKAYELGVTFFDTAEAYSDGRSEKVLGMVLGKKLDALICTKVGGRNSPITDPQRIRNSAESSLKRLRRDAIDVYLLHVPSPAQVLDEELHHELEKLTVEGKIRSFGVSIQHAGEVEQAKNVLNYSGFSAIELSLNLLQRENEIVLPLLKESGLGVIARVPLASGLLTGKYDSNSTFPDGDGRGGWAVSSDKLNHQLNLLPEVRNLAIDEGLTLIQASLAWVLSHETVSTAIPGAKRDSQVEHNVTASGITLANSFLKKVRSFP